MLSQITSIIQIYQAVNLRMLESGQGNKIDLSIKYRYTKHGYICAMGVWAVAGSGYPRAGAVIG